VSEAVVGRGLVEILPDFRKWGKQLAADMRVAKAQLDGSTAGLKAAAATTVTSMAKIGKGVTLVGVGVAVAATKMAGDFQAETAVLQTAAGETAGGLKIVRQGILDIAKGTGTGIKNLTDGMYLIEKAGFRGSDGLKVLKAAAQGAREENAKLSDVTNAMTSIMASYHLKATDSVRVMNGMKTAAGEGKITMEEFSGAMSTVLPIASANKISFEQVAGAVATLTQHGTSAREATHELGATIRALASPNMVAQREMARFGLSSVDVSTKLGKRGLTGTFDLLTGTILSKMGPSGKILLSAFEGTKQSAEDARIMLSKIPPELQKNAKAFLDGKIEADDWKATIQGAPIAMQPMLRNFNTLVNRSKGFSRELKSGGPAAKTYTDALKKMSGGAIGLNTVLQLSGESTEGFKERVKKVGESFHNGSKDVEGWKITQGLLNVQLERAKQSVHVLMIEIGTKLIPVVSAVIGFFANHTTVTMALLGALASLLGVLSAVYIATKLFAMYTKLAAAAQLIWTVATLAQTDSLMVLRAQLALLWVQEQLAAVWTGILTAATYAWGAAIAIATSPITLVVIGIAALVAGIVYLAVKTKFFQTLWRVMWGGIKAAVTGFVNWLKSNWQLVIWAILTGGIGLAVAEIVRHWDGVKQAFSATIDWLKHNWPLILAILGGPVGLAVLYIVRHWKGISDGAKAAFDATINFAVSFGKSIGDFFSKLPGQLAGFFSSLPGKIGHWFSEAASASGKFFSQLPGQIKNAATGGGSALLSMGGSLISGLFKGATDFFSKSVPGFFKMLWHGIVDFFKNVFGISSPSTVMAGLGINLMQGLIKGLVSLISSINVRVITPIKNFFTKAIPDAAKTARDRVTGFFSGMEKSLVGIKNTISSGVITPIKNFFTKTLANAAKSARDAVVGAFRWLALKVLDAFGSIIHGAAKLFGWVPGVGGKLKSASKAFDSFRDRVNASLGGIKDKKVNVNTSFDAKIEGGKGHAYGSAAGGPVPTYLGTPGKDSVKALLTPDEHVWTVKEVMAAGGHNVLKRLRKLALAGKLKGYALGGRVQAYASGGAVDATPHLPSAGSIDRSTTSAVLALVKKYAKQIWESLMPDLGPGGGAGVKRWTGVVQSVLSQLHQPLSYTGMTLRRMNQESGGNPTIVNRWDSNWKAGHPSVGLMQVIRGTFQHYAGKYRTKGPFMYGVSTNPTANVYSSARYALGAYGSLPRAYNRAGGYDLGGVAGHVGAWFKNTNRPERILSPRQTEAFDRLVNKITTDTGGGGSTVVIERLVLENHGVIGSKREVQDWLVDALDQLKRRGRL
jgi:TP901 family phage tail tape measure protein